MSSSTSSSNDTRDPGAPAPRKPYVKALLAIVLGMSASMAVVRGFTALNDASAETILDRVMEARAALPKIVQEEKPLVMFFGSSMTHAAFGARQFDREMDERGIEVKSFNFGFGGLNPYFQDYLSRRIRDAFVENDRRLELVMIEFTPLCRIGAVTVQVRGLHGRALPQGRHRRLVSLVFATASAVSTQT